MDKYIKTTRGIIPLEDYLDICAESYGFSDYEMLRESGYDIEISESDIIVATNSNNKNI